MERTTPESAQTSGVVTPSLKIEDNALYFEGTHLPLYSGSIDYWRTDNHKWKNLLESIRGLGLRIISTSIPWNIHERSDGTFDFGRIDERKDLKAFLSLCGTLGLYVIVRPGPAVNAELATFGYPSRIIYDPTIQAKSAQETPVVIPAVPIPFPMPSYASEKFYDETSKYFDVLCPLLLPHLAPGGPIIGVQIDNELPLLFMQGPFSADYSPSALRWYHEFLATKYPTIDRLNRSYRTRYAQFQEVEPPRGLGTSEREALPRYLDWIEFQEYYIVLALSVITSLLWARGIRGVITHHSIRSIYPRLPLNVLHTEKELDIQGVGLYLGQKAYDRIRRGALYLSTVSRLPFLSETGMGTWPWGPPLNPSDQQYAILVALMYGFRGFNIHMLVERNRWTGSPISRNGKKSDQRAGFLRRLLTVLTTLQMHKLQRNVPVLLLRNLEYERLGSLCNQANWMTNLLNIPTDLLTSDRTFSYTDIIQRVYPNFWEALYWGLTVSKVPFQIGDTDLDRPALSQYQVLFLPTYDYMSETLQQTLLDYVERGGTAVIGPEIPYLDSDMRTRSLITDATLLEVKSTRRPLVGLHDVLQIQDEKILVGSRHGGMTVPYQKGTFVYLGLSFPPTMNRYDATDAGDAVSKVLASLEMSPVGDTRAPFVDELYWGTRAPQVIFLANSSNQPKSVEVQIAKRNLLRDAWTGEQLLNRGPQEINLDPYKTQIFEVIR